MPAAHWWNRMPRSLRRQTDRENGADQGVLGLPLFGVFDVGFAEPCKMGLNKQVIDFTGFTTVWLGVTGLLI
jgi:hypothetical protein